MSLFHIPFYPSLMRQEIGGVTLTTNYVLLIGAIIVHSNGKYNCCVASLDVLADEIGSTKAKVRNMRSDLIRVGVVEVLEKDSSGCILTVRINSKITAALLANDNELTKKELEAFNKKLKGVQQKVEASTEVVTEVVEYNNRNEEEKEGEHKRNGGRMSPSTLYTRLKTIYHIRRDADKKSCIKAVEQLQSVFDDDTILEAAVYFYSDRRLHPKRFEDGRTWWPDFFWILRNDKFSSVVEEIKKVPNLFTDGETTKSNGYMEGISWNG